MVIELLYISLRKKTRVKRTFNVIFIHWGYIYIYESNKLVIKVYGVDKYVALD